MNSLINPFVNIETNLNDLDADLLKFYQSFNINDYDRRIVSIDKENMEVHILKDCYAEEDSPIQAFKFSAQKGYQLLNELALSFTVIRDALNLHRKQKKFSTLNYLDTLEFQIENIFTEELLDKYSFLENYKRMISQSLLQFKSFEKAQNLDILLLKISTKEGEAEYAKLEKLHSLLTESAIISATIEDFTKAFTGHLVENGIKWLAKSPKNNSTNKPLMIYFFRKLIDKGHLRAFYLTYENYYLTTIFRNFDGSRFTSQQLSSAKYSMSSKSSPQKKLIDDIISQL